MSKSVLAIRFTPMDEVEVDDWVIRLNSVDKSNGSCEGEFSGQPPGERYTWQWSGETRTVFVKPHPSGTVTNFTYGFPDPALREALFDLIERQTKAATD